MVKEDSLTLYGFMDTAEQAAFRMLQTVQGVGAKAALSILTTLPANELSQAILVGDKAMVSRADGIGPKLAQRIITAAQKLPASLTTGPAPFGPASAAGLMALRLIPDSNWLKMRCRHLSILAIRGPKLLQRLVRRNKVKRLEMCLLSSRWH